VKRKLLTFVLFFLWVHLFAQEEDAWVYFKDKPSETTFMATPLNMLTQRALDRRNRYNIPLDNKDVPVEAAYIAIIENAIGIEVMAKSKWLNALHVRGNKTDIDALKALKKGEFNFVSSIVYANKTLNVGSKISTSKKGNKSTDKLKFQTNFNYGQAANQIRMLKGDMLHEQNFTGAGMQIAVIDAGFPNVNTYAAFKRMRDNNQILGGYDFVNRNTNFYTGNYHGMAVLSTIAGYVENQFVGTAPDASFYLFITEDSVNETPLEESLWVEAAEEADRLGVDVINTSLGYYDFDNSNYNYTYNDMNGQTTFISRGAEIAFSRGMILINSAGNEGNNAWHYIIAPADAVSVLSIGAVSASGVIASFSSYGPTVDGRVKPDVCAEGAGVYIINASGSIATSNGTSFSGPVMAGVTTCLWQAFPTKSNAEITQLIKESAHLYSSPTAQEGYGIPNFQTIYNNLFIEETALDKSMISVYPNPSKDIVNFNFPEGINSISIAVFDVLGKLINTKIIDKNNPSYTVSGLSKGLYFIQTHNGNQFNTIKFIKN
jgi:serine protease AprX